MHREISSIGCVHLLNSSYIPEGTCTPECFRINLDLAQINEVGGRSPKDAVAALTNFGVLLKRVPDACRY